MTSGQRFDSNSYSSVVSRPSGADVRAFEEAGDFIWRTRRFHKEMELDCAMALQNLIERFRLGLDADIPARAPFSANAHIITADLEPSMKIPAALAMDSAKLPDHVRRFHAALSTIVPRLNQVLQAEN